MMWPDRSFIPITVQQFANILDLFKQLSSFTDTDTGDSFQKCVVPKTPVNKPEENFLTNYVKQNTLI